MGSHQYFRPFDPTAEDSLARLAELIPPGSTVLDLGCGPGVLAQHLTSDKACVVDGVEWDVLSVEHAVDWLRTLRRLDLETADLVAAFPGRRYDRIVCADVLEHLRDPARLLAALPDLLAPDGTVLLSVPNVGHAGLVAELIGGDFRYRTEGLVDCTHLRFFTRRSLLELLSGAGLRAEAVTTVERPLPLTEFAAEALARLPEETRRVLLDRPDATAYQFIVAARPSGAPASRPRAHPLAMDLPVDVIVPVHGNRADLERCLDSLLRATNAHRCEIVVVDDASPGLATGPDAGLHDLLQAHVAAGRITLLRHDTNRGFAAAVNTGLALHADRDAVLLNSDTEVSGDWLDRLQRAAYADARTGTATPFSNAASICGYPQGFRDNALPVGWSTPALDGLFRRVNRDRGVELPTAVGFCMYVRRDCLTEVGPFDADGFGAGYGEENDFCMRARAKGWRHRLAADTFVWHRGGGSFGPAKAARMAAAAAKLRERHPTYEPLVTEFLAADPARELRRNVDLARLAASPRPRLLAIGHDLGGGVEKHLRDLAAVLADQVELLALRPASGQRLALTWERAGEEFSLWFDPETQLDALVDLLRALGVARVHIHHWLGLDRALEPLVRRLGLPFDVTVHDFYAFCPHPDLTAPDGRACPLDPRGDCAVCGKAAPVRREGLRWLLDEAARILVPSRATAQLLAAFVPRAPVLVVPHDRIAPVAQPLVRVLPWSPGEELRVAVVGTLSLAKGRQVLQAAAAAAAARDLPVAFHLLGEPDAPMTGLPELPLTLHGAYDAAALGQWLARLRPHLVWFPAIWPETYTYVVSDCLAAGLPIVAPDIGAFPERLAGRDWTVLFPATADGGVWLDRLLDVARAHLATGRPPVPATGPAVGAAPFDYRTDYLAPLPAPDPLAVPMLPVLPPEVHRAPPRRFGPRRPSGDWMRDRLLLLHERNRALEGGIAERDSTILRQWGEIGRLCHYPGRLEAAEAELAQARTILEDRAQLLSRTVETLHMVRADLDEQIADKVRAADLLREREVELERRATHIARLDDEIAALRGTLAARDAALAEGEARLVQLAEGIVQLRQSVAEQQEIVADLRETLERERGESVHLRQESARLRQAEVALAGDLARREAELAQARAVLAHRDVQLAAVHASMSWRLSVPVRLAGRPARRFMRPFRDRNRQPLPSSLPPGGLPAPYDPPAPAALVEPAPPAPSGRPAARAAERLRIATGVADMPVVTVVIPVFNQIAYTLACLDSIARALPRTPFEVIVVDDASTDSTATELGGRDDIRYLRNADNLGFIGACNRGAAAGRGEFLLFLNNDTTVEPGWLDALVETFASHLQAGLVGAKLVYPDGTLQEAGGIVFADGSGWNWGRGGDPDDPAYNFVRDVDYCSGAAVMVRTDLFRALGGFDADFAPAYYEDTDLAFAVRARGYRVLYQPLSRVVHYEGVTSGTDEGAGVKRFQAVNRPKFLAKWRAALATHGDPPDGDLTAVRRASDRRPAFRLLVVDATTPTPDQDSGSVDMFNLLRILDGLGGRVSFVPESNFAHMGRYTAALQAQGVECLHHPYVTAVPDLLAARGREFDVILLARGPHAVKYLDDVARHAPQARLVFDTVDLHYLRVERRAALTGDPDLARDAETLRRMETEVVRRADLTLVRSRTELAELHRIGLGDRVRVLPLIREVPPTAPGFAGRSGLIFVGGFRHDPNVDAVRWFVAEVWPRVRSRLPDAVFRIVGSNLPPEVADLAGGGVEVLGFVPDIAPLMEQARLSVAPLRYGAGLKGKLATSFGHGLPAVATPIATEGMGLAPDEACLVAERADDFADAVVSLYDNEALWTRLAAEGLAYCRREFSVEVNAVRVSDMLRSLGVAVAPPWESVRRAAE